MTMQISPRVLPFSLFETPLSHPNGVIEEGVLEKIFQILTPTSRYCVEFGAGDGKNYLLTRHLIEKQGWRAFLIEGSPQLAQKMREYNRDNPRVTAVESFITAENIEELFAQAQVPTDFDFLSIDLDGNDFYIWKALKNYRPRVICVEFNASYGPQARFTVDYDPTFVWQGDDYFGASIATFMDLAKEKSYVAIHSVAGGGNAFFVDQKYAHLFERTLTLQEMYQPPQYGKFGRALNGKGHRASARNTTALQRFSFRLRYYLMTPVRRAADIYRVATVGRRLKTYNSSDRRLF